jgi:hypothetical protein
MERVLLDEALLEQFLVDGSSKNLLSSVRGFVKHQVANWPDLTQARNQLCTTQLRNIFLSNLTVTLQFNPGRIVSAQAPVDNESIRKRPCFLCIENLPSRQKALLYQCEWLILNNPAPLFYDHLVISHQQHVPQRIDNALQAMISLVSDLDFQFEAFYNGPACGASAPDHLHFQMCPRGGIPFVAQIDDMIKNSTGTAILNVIDEQKEGISFTGYVDNRSVFICRTSTLELLQSTLSRVLIYLKTMTGCPEEPMVNLIIAGIEEYYYGIVFPRKMHRPACYYRTDARQILVSPGSVDVGGLVILPRREDYAHLDKDMLLTIFREVCYGPDIFTKLTLH